MALEIPVGPSGYGGDKPAEASAAAAGGASQASSAAAASNGDRQYKRACRLVIGDSSGGGIDVSDLRVRFTVQQGNTSVRNHANIIVSNLSKETMDKVPKDGAKISLSAGYEGNQGVIFQGSAIQKRTGRENPTDTYLNLIAVDGDVPHNFAVVKKTLAAGHTFRDQVDAALEAMKPFGVTAGYIADLGSTKMPRARVLFGMARNILRDIGFATNTTWSIQQGKLQVLENQKALPGQITVLNSRTGMIGLPVQTPNGIIVRCLLNPTIKPGSRVKIDQSSIQQASFNPAYGQEANNAMIPSLADDGIYKVYVIDYEGDTRGGPWYCDLTCVGASQTIPIGLASVGIVDPDISGPTGSGNN